MLLLEAAGRTRSLPLPVPGGCSIPWLVAASLQSLPLWARCLLLFSVMCPLLSVRSPMCLIWILVIAVVAHPDNPGRSQDP